MYVGPKNNSTNEPPLKIKALSVGIGLGVLNPVRSAKAKDIPFFKQAIKKAEPTVGTNTNFDESFSPGEVSSARLPAAPTREFQPMNYVAKPWWIKLFGHFIDLAIVVISACIVILTFGLVGNSSSGSVTEIFNHSLYFWLGKFSVWEIILIAYAGLIIYWMIFRLVAGHTIGQSLGSVSMNSTAARALLKNK